MSNRTRRIINSAQMPIRAMPGVRAYNIVQNDENAEITMYGEVVETIPTDWWTGEPVAGLFIVLSDFLKDLDEIKGKNSITVRINSIGGDLFSGVAIYNRLKEMNNVTTIVDGLAASAASIIAQAGDTRQIYEAGQVMIHGASVGLCDYFNMQQLTDVMSQLSAANDAVINVYAERTGETKTKLKHMVEKTTWMTGQEAVDQGFADEVITGKNVTMSMSSDRSLFLCNGIPMNAKKLATMPRNVTVVPEKTQMQTANNADAINHETNKGGKIMDVKQLREQYPDAVKQIENEARQSEDTKLAQNKAVEEATVAERQRIKDIESIEESIADKKLIEEAKYGEKPMDAKDLAFVAMQKQAQLGNNFLAANREDTIESGAADVQSAPNSGIQGAEKEPKDEAADITAAVNVAKAIRGGK